MTDTTQHWIAALTLAARDLEKAHRLADPDAHRCRNCGDPFTPRIRTAETAVLYAARQVGSSLLPAAAEEERDG